MFLSVNDINANVYVETNREFIVCKIIDFILINNLLDLVSTFVAGIGQPHKVFLPS